MKLLFVKNQILFPLNVGGNIRTYNILRYLAKWHDITFLCNTNSLDLTHIGKMSEFGLHLETITWRNPASNQWQFYRDLALNMLTSTPFSVDKVTNPQLRTRANELIAKERFDAIICDFVQMANVVTDLRCRPKILFQHNVEAQVLERQAKTGANWLRRRIMALQWRKMLKFESRVGKQFDAVIAVSDVDSAFFKNHYGWQHVADIDTAVDIEYFVPTDLNTEPQQLATFVASMDWLPNRDAAIYFVNNIWPLIKCEHPDAQFHIVGRNPSRTIQRLAHADGVRVIGTVPDVRPHLSDAQVVVVPLLAGSGTRIKIFEAMAMGKAVVSTSIGAEGLKVEDGQHLLIADTPRDFANAVSGLLNNRQEQRRIGQNARNLVCRHFSSEIVARQFEQICQQVVDKSLVH